MKQRNQRSSSQKHRNRQSIDGLYSFFRKRKVSILVEFHRQTRVTSIDGCLLQLHQVIYCWILNGLGFIIKQRNQWSSKQKLSILLDRTLSLGKERFHFFIGDKHQRAPHPSRNEGIDEVWNELCTNLVIKGILS